MASGQAPRYQMEFVSQTYLFPTPRVGVLNHIINKTQYNIVISMWPPLFNFLKIIFQILQDVQSGQQPALNIPTHYHTSSGL